MNKTVYAILLSALFTCTSIEDDLIGNWHFNSFVVINSNPDSLLACFNRNTTELSIGPDYFDFSDNGTFAFYTNVDSLRQRGTWKNTSNGFILRDISPSDYIFENGEYGYSIIHDTITISKTYGTCTAIIKGNK